LTNLPLAHRLHRLERILNMPLRRAGVSHPCWLCHDWLAKGEVGLSSPGSMWTHPTCALREREALRARVSLEADEAARPVQQALCEEAMP